jgi:serine/threonine-protein kinase
MADDAPDAASAATAAAVAPAPPAASLLLPDQIVAGRYRVLRLLGAGGMGAVYEVEHVKTKRVLALKVLLPELAKRPAVVQRFLSEARAAAALRHRAIVEITDMDVEGDMNFLVMEKLEGEELAARIKRDHPLSPAFVARVGAEIADAMTAAHENTFKIIHRDLKPQNVFLQRHRGGDETVKVLDFGIAKLVEDDNLAQALTHTGDVYGTPLYMSPEQMRSSKDVDERTDIYAIGAILYQALTGRTPFVADSYPDLVLKVGTEQPPAIRTLRPDAPATLVAIIERALARNRDARWRTAAELRDVLRAFLAGAAVDVQMPTVARTIEASAAGEAPRAPRRGRVAIGVALAAALAAAGAAALRKPSGVTPPPPPPPLTDGTGTKPQPQPQPQPSVEEPTKPAVEDKPQVQPPVNEESHESTPTPGKRKRKPPPLPNPFD